MKLKLLAAVFALCAAFGLSAASAADQVTVTGSSFRVNSANVANGVNVRLIDAAGGVEASATTDENGKFTLPDLAAGKYTLTLTFAQQTETSATPAEPEVRKFILTVTEVRGEPLRKELALKADPQPSPRIKKLPGKWKAGNITVTRGLSASGETVLHGVITLT